MSEYTFFGGTEPAGLAYSVDSVAQQHGVTLGFLFGYTPSLAVSRRLIGFRLWITQDQVTAGLNLNGTFTAILWGALLPTAAIYAYATLMARKDFTGLVVGANDFFFDTPFDVIPDTVANSEGRYSLLIYYPPGNAYYSADPGIIAPVAPATSGQKVSAVDPSGDLYIWTGFWGAGAGVSQGGIYSYGNPAGVAPEQNLGQGGMGGTTDWYGMDIIVDDISNPSVDVVGISDSITVSRGGLPASVTATGTATDTLSKSATKTLTANVVEVVPPRVITKAAQQSRCCWGSYPSYSVVTGPTPENTGAEINVGTNFHVEWDCQCVGCYIYKPPLAAGEIPVGLWKNNGTLLASTTLTWVSDGGGWQEVLFDNPVQLLNKDGVVTTPSNPNLGIPIPNVSGGFGSLTEDLEVNQYVIGWFSPSGDYVYSQSIFASFAFTNAPIIIDCYNQAVNGGGCCYSDAPIATMPNTADPGNYYVDPIVQWVDPALPPAFDGTTSFFEDQFSGNQNFSQHDFPIGVFWPDPNMIQEYMSYGINVVFSGGDDIGGPGYAAAIKAANVEHWPSVSGANATGDVANWWETSTVLAEVDTDPVYAALVKGYYIVDEPDQGSISTVPASSLNNEQAGYASPAVVQTWITGVRGRDSTRPIIVGLDHISGINCGTYIGEPVNESGDNVYNEEMRRQYGRIADILAGDWYNITANYGVPNGLWTAFTWVKRLREITDYRVPIFADLETAPGDGTLTGPTGYATLVEKNFWAYVIAGVAGIGIFDHWFTPTGSSVPNMDNYMLQVDSHGGDDSVRQMILSISTLVGTMGAAMRPIEMGLVSECMSSNKTAGPVGGTFGVPIEYTTRSDGTHYYVIAQGSRPGDTTGTITIPTAPNTTLTVMNESRTVTTDANGTFSDDFAADYSFHIYQWPIAGGGGAGPQPPVDVSPPVITDVG